MLKGLLATPYRLSKPLIDPQRVFRGIPLYVGYFKDLLEYRRRGGSSSITLKDLNTHIYRKASSHGFDAHYLYQAVWVFRLILESRAEHHIDVASEAKFVAMLSAVVETTFIDIRPLAVNLDNFHSKAGSILDLPYPDASIDSLSCLHSIEHISLGRYGDAIDPQGTRRAARELTRVLAPGGNLYISLPDRQTSRVLQRAPRSLNSPSAGHVQRAGASGVFVGVRPTRVRQVLQPWRLRQRQVRVRAVLVSTRRRASIR